MAPSQKSVIVWRKMGETTAQALARTTVLPNAKVIVIGWGTAPSA
jgi:hypothetical protein